MSTGAERGAGHSCTRITLSRGGRGHAVGLTICYDAGHRHQAAAQPERRPEGRRKSLPSPKGHRIISGGPFSFAARSHGTAAPQRARVRSRQTGSPTSESLSNAPMARVLEFGCHNTGCAVGSWSCRFGSVAEDTLRSQAVTFASSGYVWQFRRRRERRANIIRDFFGTLRSDSRALMPVCSLFREPGRGARCVQALIF